MSDNLILVDTSVWICYFKDEEASTCSKLEQFIDSGSVCVAEVILAELLQGAKDKKDVASLCSYFKHLPRITASDEDWKEAGLLSYESKKKGHAIPLVDCYIAIIAKRGNCRLFSLDKHFQYLAAQRSIQLVD